MSEHYEPNSAEMNDHSPDERILRSIGELASQPATDYEKYVAQLIAVLPNRMTADIDDDERNIFTNMAEHRHGIFARAVNRSCGVDEAVMDRSFIQELLSDFAQKPSSMQHGKDIPSDYNAVRAAMVWAYLQGVNTTTMTDIVVSHWGEWYRKVKISPTLQSVYRHAQTLHRGGGRSGVLTRGKAETDSSLLLGRLDTLNRLQEDAAIDLYVRQPRIEVTRDRVGRESRARQLHESSGVSKGAFRRLLGLTAGEEIHPEDIVKARAQLRELIVQHMQHVRTDRDIERLQPLQLRLLFALSGSELTKDATENKLVERPLMHPPTLSSLCDISPIISTATLVRQTPRDIERLVLSGIDTILHV